MTSQIGRARVRPGSHPMLARDDGALVRLERPIGARQGNRLQLHENSMAVG